MPASPLWRACARVYKYWRTTIDVYVPFRATRLQSQSRRCQFEAYDSSTAERRGSCPPTLDLGSKGTFELKIRRLCARSKGHRLVLVTFSTMHDKHTFLKYAKTLKPTGVKRDDYLTR